MPYVPVQHAAAALDVSDRTIRRRIDAGDLKTVREGGRVMVWVDCPTTADTLSKSVGQIAESSQATAITLAADQRMMSDMLTLTKTIREDYRADLRAARWTALATSMLVLTSVGILAYGGYRWHLATVEHVQTVAGLGVALEASERDRASLRDSLEESGVQVRAGQEAQAQASVSARLAVQERDQARAERDRALAALRATRIVEAVVAWLSTGPAVDAGTVHNLSLSEEEAKRASLLGL